MGAKRKREFTADMPPELPTLSEEGRKEIATWLNRNLQEMAEATEARIEYLKTHPHHPSPTYRAQVRNLAGLGLDEATICKVLELKPSIYRRHYADDFHLGIAEVNIQIAQNMMNIARDPDHPQAARVGMRWLEVRAGEAFRAPQKLEIDDMRKKNELPVIDSSKLSPEDRRTMREMIRRYEENPEPQPEQPTEGALIEYDEDDNVVIE